MQLAGGAWGRLNSFEIGLWSAKWQTWKIAKSIRLQAASSEICVIKNARIDGSTRLLARFHLLDETNVAPSSMDASPRGHELECKRAEAQGFVAELNLKRAT